MKRTDLIRHLEARHTVYKNSTSGAYSAVPRHREIKKGLVRKICDDLGIPSPQL